MDGVFHIADIACTRIFTLHDNEGAVDRGIGPGLIFRSSPLSPCPDIPGLISGRSAGSLHIFQHEELNPAGAGHLNVLHIAIFIAGENLPVTHKQGLLRKIVNRIGMRHELRILIDTRRYLGLPVDKLELDMRDEPLERHLDTGLVRLSLLGIRNHLLAGNMAGHRELLAACDTCGEAGIGGDGRCQRSLVHSRQFILGQPAERATPVRHGVNLIYTAQYRIPVNVGRNRSSQFVGT